eukprot:COSAG05_NODE_14879_length_384_cov_1.077193_2_plen_79_part_00
MWSHCLSLIVSICVLACIPMFTKVYAEHEMGKTRKLVLAQFQAIASNYTENGTPAELAKMVEDLEEIMEELKFLDKNE